MLGHPAQTPVPERVLEQEGKTSGPSTVSREGEELQEDKRLAFLDEGPRGGNQSGSRNPSGIHALCLQRALKGSEKVNGILNIVADD